MADTTFHNDYARIIKYNIETSDIARYIFDVPGNLNGDVSHHCSDPHLRLQGTGSKLKTDMVDLESELRCMNRPLNRDNVMLNNYKSARKLHLDLPLTYKNDKITEESHLTAPAWKSRDVIVEQDPGFLIYNPQENGIFHSFRNGLDTRQMERDYYDLATKGQPVYRQPRTSPYS